MIQSYTKLRLPRKARREFVYVNNKIWDFTFPMNTGHIKRFYLSSADTITTNRDSGNKTIVQ